MFESLRFLNRSGDLFGARRLALIGLVAGFSLGCGEKTVQLPTVDTYPVHGKVVLADGTTPLTEGTITFFPVNSETARQASGKINSDGTYSLVTSATQEGAAAGEYRVSVMSTASTPSSDGKFGTPLVDPRFGDEDASGLKATVKAEPTDIPPFVLDPAKLPTPEGPAQENQGRADDARDRG